ncbi:MAG: diguanylate cyclase [Gammaproteobacteria bacterium]|nr:diguanylate cyclase [Gammaproteobacteria bacterium]
MKNIAKNLTLGIRQKVLLLLMTVLLTALSVSGWFALKEEKASVLSDIKQRGTDISRFVAKSLAYSVVGYDYHTISLLLDEITQSDDIAYAKVVNKKGNIMAEAGEVAAKDAIKQMIFEQPISFEDEVIGTLTLSLNTQTKIGRLENQRFSLIKREALIILLIAMGEFLALSFIIMRPVSIISKSLDDQVHDDGQIIGKIPITSKDEFGDLASRFNNLSENLNSANRELKSRVDYADAQLVKNNIILKKQAQELQVMNKEFKKLSITDPLTSLFNRRYFEEALESEMKMSVRHKETNSLIMVDIDHFKSVNDTFGHEAGDIVIKEVSALMTKMLRSTDVVCRIGGEEFVSLCKRADKQSALELAEKLRKAVEQHRMNIDGTELSITISIGVVTLSPDNRETHAANICRYADIALYESKNTGRNRVVHYDDLVS